MTMTATATPTDIQDAAIRSFGRKRMTAFLVPGVILTYLVYIFFAFDFPGLAERARMDNARILLSDFWSHKTHVTRDNRTGEVVVAIEGENKGTYPPGMLPDWVTQADDVTTIDLGRGHSVVYDATGARYIHPDYGTISVTSTAEGVTVDAPEPIPDWLEVAGNRVQVTTDQGRFSVTRNRTETFYYEPGWELFFFTLDSPFYGKGPLDLAGLALWGDRVDPARSNIGYMTSEVWNNAMWRHKDVAWAIGETMLMAFLGTFMGAIIALPLAFMAASNFSSFGSVRFAMRRVFDFVRGVDALIWTIILARAFGPGPMTGALAIMITDTGAFGKQFSETLENIDEKQVEGLRSTGANAIQRARFGVLPQITPVLLGQVLYSFESNTRSATIIGAIVGGGIGLLLTQAISTQKDWEEVAYYMMLIIAMVIIIDSISGWLRRKLIKGE
jgi:phosphonate transport system permease protein